ncbi:glycosyltransferase family 39 protein [Chthonobacter rhizosphaerae]|uniref:glycosyltransferase family 39 protein n=1 Tax=Chthonobacter rhizosphaerae TaxID=2735553 RepID=UPI0015EE57C9|nr:glycosyltransferase family 39 protein [Chthonobacter rhizosphaerae]
MGRRTAWLSAPGTVAGFWLIYGLVHTLALGLLYPSVAHVDANSVDTMQGVLAAAYQVNNPPSYEWMLYAVQQVAGEGPMSHLILRYMLMGLLGVIVYAMVRAYSGSAAQGAAASYGLLGFFWFAWYMHEGMTHTITLVVLCFPFLAATVRHLERPTVASAVLLGLAAGVGLIAKFNFAILIGAVALTAASDRTMRGRLLDGRLLLTVAVAAMIATPVILAVRDLGGDIAAMSAQQLTENREGHLARSLVGAGRYVGALVLFFLPWGLIAAWLLVRSRQEGAAERPAVRPVAERLFGRFNRVAIPAGFVAVILFGVVSASERYLFPVALCVVLAFHVTLARRIDERRQVAVFAGVGAVVFAVTLGVRVAMALTGSVPEDRENKRLDPYDRLAVELDRRGLGEAFFIANDRYEAGNLATFLPTAHAAGLLSQRLRQPMTYAPNGRCVLFYKGRFETDGPRPQPAAPPKRIAALMPAGAAVETVRVPWQASVVGPPRTGVFHLVDLGTGAQACQDVFGAAE